MLKEEDVGRIGDYVKPWLRELIDRMVPRAETVGVGSALLERMVRVEDELKAQRELMDERFGFMEQRFVAVDNRFEAVDKRFEDLIAHLERRFDAVDKRFEASDKRFEDLIAHTDKRFEANDKRFEDLIVHTDKRFDTVDKRFNTLTWMIGVGFVVVTSLTTVFALLA